MPWGWCTVLLAPVGTPARLLRRAGRAAGVSAPAMALWCLFFGFDAGGNMAAADTEADSSGAYVCRVGEHELVVPGTSLYWPTWAPSAGARPLLPQALLQAAWAGLVRDLPAALPGAAAAAATTAAAAAAAAAAGSGSGSSSVPLPLAAVGDDGVYVDPALTLFEDVAHLPTADTPPPYVLAFAQRA
jgi:hypothetical protein